jgi:tetratricopeptide (TPR) repeat protein
MRWCLKVAGPVILAIVLTAPAWAQDEDTPPPPPPTDTWSYQSPGPAKCVEIGNFYLHKKKLAAALSRFQEAIQINSHYAPAYLGLGKTYEKMGLKQKALSSYQQYLDALPSDKDAEEAKDVQRAIARLRQEMSTQPAAPTRR